MVRGYHRYKEIWDADIATTRRFVGKYFVVRFSTTKTTKILPLENYPLYGISLSIQISILCLAVCILHPTETQSPSHIQNTKDTPTITSLRNYNYVVPRTKWRLVRSTAPYYSYRAAPRRTAPGPSNLCPSYLTTLVTIHSSYGCLVKKKN